jgi:hypothetical protein
LSDGAFAKDADQHAQPFQALLTSAPAAIAAGILLLLALILRILGARGELWLDELWSLDLIAEARQRHDLFWGLAADNNHYLNTLYLTLVGADAPVLLQRALSIVLGTVTVAVAALAMRPADKAGALSAMALFATSYPMVNYGSEARGYAGLILMILLALLLTEAAAAGSRTHRRWLGVVSLIGVMFQPIMLGAIAALMGGTAWLSRPAGAINARALLATALATARTFTWTVRLLIPFAALIVFSVLHAGGYRIAGTVPFTATGFVAGYGGMLRLLLGLPEALPDWVALLIGAALLGLGLRFALRRAPQRAALYVAVLIALPLAMFVARLPNIHFPRYYLAPAVVFLLLLADLFAMAWSRGGALRWLGLGVLLAIVAGNGLTDARLLADGRDQSAAMMRLVGGSGPALVSSDQDVRNRPVVDYFAARFDLPVSYVPTAEICTRNPEWIISSSVETEMPEAFDTTTVGCNRIFRKAASFPQWGLSGLPWTVYRVVK